MAAQTFGDVWRLVALHVPGAPTGLVQSWVQSAYDALIGRRHWAFLRVQTLLTTLASRSVTATTIQASTTVTSAALFLATDVGRQFRVGTGPVYTIASFTNSSLVTLTQAYAETGGSVTASIHDRYLLMPENFRSFHDVTDLTIQRPIIWWISKERLDLDDPARATSDSRFRVLASHELSQVPVYAGRLTYEAWPAPTAAGTYVVNYFKRTDRLADDDAFLGVLATWTESLKKGALAQAAQWPGTATQRNPYFNLQLAAALQTEFLALSKNLDVMDDDQYLMDLQQTDLSRFGLSAVSADTASLRASDAGLSDYFGG